MDAGCIILDFDGTFTDVDKEADPFLESYQLAVNEVIGEDVADAWIAMERVVRTTPWKFGWQYNGRTVAPANADPYLRATVVTNLILDERKLIPDPAERTKLLQQLYKTNYPKAESVFRPEAKSVIEELIATGTPVWVVTNSDTSAVNDKLDKLAPKGRERLNVRGDAQKFVVVEPTETDGRFAALPAEERLQGLDRPLYLRRGRYYELLREIWAITETSPEQTFLVGDIYELDLAMPAHFGVSIHLLARTTTPDYERHAVERHGGHVSERLSDVLDRLI